jgi:hypothetical protein
MEYHNDFINNLIYILENINSLGDQKDFLVIKMERVSSEREYLRWIEKLVEGRKSEEGEAMKEDMPVRVKVVKLNEFEKKIKDKNFIRKVVATLRDLYEWKLEQYQTRIEELVKIFKKDDRVIRTAKLTEEERKEVGMSSASNLKLMYASLADTFELVQKKYIEFANAEDEIIDEIQSKFVNIVNDGERGLKTLVGKQYENIKTNICTLLSSLEGGINSFTKTFQNVVIVGPAGVGKTTLAKYLAFYYNESGILATDVVNIITRPDLVGQYLGETGMKTKRKMIDSLEGITFIDEAYQLGGCPDPDTYGMESITEIVNFLDKFMALSIVIVAGYENEMNLCFFSRNEGLRRRFPNQYKLKDYEFYDLFMIFMKGCYKVLYEYYSLVANNKSAEAAYNASQGFVTGVLNAFGELNQQKCKRLTNQIDKETGQYVKDKETGLYKKTFEETSCYFQNQGGDVGILVSKFFNNYYTKNNPSISFLGALLELGLVKQVDILKVKQDVDHVMKYFPKQDLNQEYYESKTPLVKKPPKDFKIPDLTKIMSAPGQDVIDKTLSKINIDKLKNTAKGISGGNAYVPTTVKNIANQLGGQNITTAVEAAQFVLQKYNEWIEEKEKKVVVPQELEDEPKIPQTPKKKVQIQASQTPFKFNPPPATESVAKKKKAEQESPAIPQSKKVKTEPQSPEKSASTSPKTPLSPKAAQVLLQNQPKEGQPLWVPGENTPAEIMQRIDPNKIIVNMKGGKGKTAYSKNELQEINKYLEIKTPSNAKNEVLAQGIYDKMKKSGFVLPNVV